MTPVTDPDVLTQLNGDGPIKPRTPDEQNMAVQIADLNSPAYAGDAAVEANPANDVELDKAISNATTLEENQVLFDEKANRAAKKRQPVTDPTILAKLNGPVTDPNILSQLNGDQKPSFIGGAYKEAGQRLKDLGQQDLLTEGPNPDFHDLLGSSIAKGVGAVKGGLEFGAQLANVAGSAMGRLASGTMNPAMSLEATKARGDRLTDIFNSFPGATSPSVKIGAEAPADLFAPVTKAIDSIEDPQLKQVANELFTVAAATLGGEAAKGEKAKPIRPNRKGTPLADSISPVDRPVELPTAPAAPPTEVDAAMARRNKNLDKQPVNEDVVGGQTPDMFGTEQVGTNPFLNPDHLTLDENGIPRDRGLSTDVQREAVDYPSPQDLLTEANRAVAEQADRATPQTQDSVNIAQQALWQVRERMEAAKATQEENMWRDYQATDVVARIPALKETLENPIGSGMPRVKEPITEPNPLAGEPYPQSKAEPLTAEDLAALKLRQSNRPITSRTAMGRQKGAVNFWHSTKSSFDQFDNSKMGTGEGAQIRGWGHYGSMSIGPQRHYTKVFTQNLNGGFGKDQIKNINTLYEKHFGRDLNRVVGGDTPTINEVMDAVRRFKDHGGQSFIDLAEVEQPKLAELLKDIQRDRSKYLSPEQEKPFVKRGTFNAEKHELIDHDKPIADQPNVVSALKRAEKINPKFRTILDHYKKTTGESWKELFWDDIRNVLSRDTWIGGYKPGLDPKEISQTMRSVGIKGSIFDDAASRRQSNYDVTRATRNVVMFDPKDVSIDRTYKLGQENKHVYEGLNQNKPKLPKDIERRKGIPNALDPTGIYGEAPHFDRRTPTMIEADRAVRNGNPNFGKFKQGGGINLSAFFGKDTPPKARASIDKALTEPDNRSGIEFSKDMLAEAAKNTSDKKDVGSQFGMYSGSWRAVLESVSNPNSIAHKIQLFYNRKIAEAVSELHNMNAGMKKYFSDAYDHYRISISKYTFDLGGFKDDLGKVLAMEGDPNKTWFDGKNYVPTVQQLEAHGLSPESAKVWNGIHQALDNAWDTMSKAVSLANSGTEKPRMRMPDRVPGYLPHVFKGPYAINAFKTKADGTKDYYLTHNSFNARDALAYKKAIEPAMKERGLEVSYDPPTAEGRNIDDLFRGMWKAQDIYSKNESLSKLMKGIFESSAQGIVSSVLDRSSPTRLGHALQRVGATGLDGLDRSGVIDAFKTLEQTSHDVNNWYNKVKFVNEVLFPLDSQGLLQQPNLRRNVENWTMQFMNIDNSFMKSLDVKVKDTLIKLGQNPQLVNHMLGETSSLFARAYLVGKPAFYAANRLQSTVGLGMLLLTQAQNGGKGSIAIALRDTAKMLADANRFHEGKARNPILARGIKDGKISPSFIENMGPNKFKDPVAAYIEETTRSESYLMGYHLFKQFLGQEEAFKAAGEFADRVSVPYDRQYGSPTAISRMPAPLRPMMMFMTYNQHMLGLANTMLRTSVEGVKEGDYKKASRAAAAIITAQGLQVALFGLGGITFMNNWNYIADQVESWFGLTWPNAKELAREYSPASPTLAQLAEFGAPSMLMNMDISPSGQGAGFQTPSAYTDMATTILKLGVLGLKDITQGKVTNDQWWEAAQRLPTSISGPLSHYLRNESMSDVVKKVLGEVKDYTVPKEGLHALGHERTPAESAMSLFGVQTPRLADKQITDRILRKAMKGAQVNADNIIQYLQSGKATEAEWKAGVSTLVNELNVNPATVASALKRYQMESKTTTEDRQALKGAKGSLSAKEWYRDYLDTKGMEPTQ